MKSESESMLTNLTTILPNCTARRVLETALADVHYPKFVSQARGTLLHDNWLKRLFPPISPAKTIIDMLVPNDDIDDITNAIVKESRLDQQAIGAIFSTDYQQVYCGNDFPLTLESATSPANINTTTGKNLCVIYCIVSHNLSDKVAKAAFDIGAHGPIIYYSEGRGLRDRLGWLRITKEHEKEVLMVITDEDDSEEVFDALAKAGEFHLPGRGFMYCMSIKKGIFNLPSRISHHHYAASMQQIIHAIDQLSGHTHWRDQAIFDLGTDGRFSGFEFIENNSIYLTDQECLSVLTVRSNLQPVMNLMLDLGVPGLNINFSRHANPPKQSKVNEEYVRLQAIMTADLSQQVYHEMMAKAEANDLHNIFCGVIKVPVTATYIPGKTNYRSSRNAA